jgi:hypothetical protein
MCGFTIMGLEDIFSSFVLMVASYHMQHINPHEKCCLRQYTRRAIG